LLRVDLGCNVRKQLEESDKGCHRPTDTCENKSKQMDRIGCNPFKSVVSFHVLDVVTKSFIGKVNCYAQCTEGQFMSYVLYIINIRSNELGSSFDGSLDFF